MARDLHTVVLIPTCERPGPLRAVLQDVLREIAHPTILVVQDGGDDDYVEPILDELTAEHPVTWGCGHFAGSPGGKQHYWTRVTRLFRMARRIPTYDRVLMLDDDFALVPDFVARAESVLRHSSADGLHVRRDGRDHCWGLRAQEWRRSPGCVDDFRLSSWADSAFYGTRRLLDVLEYRVNAVPPRRWRRHPQLGSGVWEQVSRRWARAGIVLAQPRRSLIRHGRHPSVMNPMATHRAVYTLEDS